MGATEPVCVEQMIAKHSIEELIVHLNKNNTIHDDIYADSSRSEITSKYYSSDTINKKIASKDESKSNSKNTETAFRLSNAKFIRSSAFGSNKRRTTTKEKNKKRVRFG